MFAFPMALLCLLSIPVIIAIHYFRQRFREQKTSTLFLFPEEHKTPRSGRKRMPLEIRGSLIFELLCATLLSLVIAMPHCQSDTIIQHHVLVLDSSLQLQAQDPEQAQGISFQQSIHSYLHDWLEQASAQDRFTLIQSGQSARLLGQSQTSAAQTQENLTLWECKNALHDYASTFHFAQQFCKDDKAERILFCGIRKPNQLPDKARVSLHGHKLHNSGLTFVSWTDEDPQHIALEILNTGPAQERQLFLSSAPGTQENKIYAQVSLRLEENSSKRILVPLPQSYLNEMKKAESTAPLIQLSFAKHDYFSQDDSVTLLPPLIRKIPIYIAPSFPNYHSVTQALQNWPLVRITKDQNDALLIFHTESQDVSKTSPDTWQFLIQTKNTPSSNSQSTRITQAPFLAQESHPLLQNIDWTGTYFAGGAVLGPNEIPLLMSYDGQLGFLVTQPTRQMISLFCDPQRSHFLAHPAWPGLLDNLINWRRAAIPGLASRNLLAHQSYPCIAAADVETMLLRSSSQEYRLPVNQERELIIPPLLDADQYILIPETKTNSSATEEPWISVQSLPLASLMSDFSANELQPEIQNLNPEIAQHQREEDWRLAWLLFFAAFVSALAAWFCHKREEGIS